MLAPDTIPVIPGLIIAGILWATLGLIELRVRARR